MMELNIKKLEQKKQARKEENLEVLNETLRDVVEDTIVVKQKNEYWNIRVVGNCSFDSRDKNSKGRLDGKIEETSIEK